VRLGDCGIVRTLSKASFSPDDWDAIIVGPGWGINQDRQAMLEMLLQQHTPLIIDADAIRLLLRLQKSKPKEMLPCILLLHRMC